MSAAGALDEAHEVSGGQRVVAIRTAHRGRPDQALSWIATPPTTRCAHTRPSPEPDGHQNVVNVAAIDQELFVEDAFDLEPQ